MARWQGGARERLMSAAMELFAEHGYDRVTVAQIAERAGLTERTFHRQFADKRDVLFTDQGEFEGLFLSGLEESDADGPMELVMAALASAARFFTPERRRWSGARQAVLLATPALQERERAKLTGVAATLAAALVERGFDPREATLATEVGLTVFHVAFTTWLEDESADMAALQRSVLAQVRRLIGPGDPLLDAAAPAPR